MGSALDDDARRLLDGVNYGFLATLMPGGHPTVDPVWVGRDGDRVLVATDGKSIKARNAAVDPRVSLAVTAFGDPYDQVLIRGTVVELAPDDDLAVLDRLSEKYLGGSFPRRKWSQRVVLVIEPTVVRSYRSSLRHPSTEERS